MKLRRPITWIVAALVLLATAGALWASRRSDETPVVLQINGVDIDQSQIDSRIASLSDVHGDIETSLGVGWRDLVLATLIDDVLVQQEAERRNIQVPTDELEAKVASIRSAAGGEEAWESWLERNRLNEEQLRVRVHNQMLAGLVFAAVTQDVAPTEAEVEAFYNANLDDYTTDGEPRPFIEVRASVETTLTTEMRDTALGQWLRDQRDAAEIEVLVDAWG